MSSCFKQFNKNRVIIQNTLNSHDSPGTRKGIIYCYLKLDNIFLFSSSDGHTKYQLNFFYFGLFKRNKY